MPYVNGGPGMQHIHLHLQYDPEMPVPTPPDEVTKPHTYGAYSMGSKAVHGVTAVAGSLAVCFVVISFRLTVLHLVDVNTALVSVLPPSQSGAAQ